MDNQKRHSQIVLRDEVRVHLENDPDISSMHHLTNYQVGTDVLAVLTKEASSKPLLIISKKCGFILERVEQLDGFSNVHYLTSEMDPETYIWRFNDYIIDRYTGKIEEIRTFPTHAFSMGTCTLRDNAFLIYDDEGTRIYNLKKLSKPFKRIFHDRGLGDNVVLVEEEVECSRIAKDSSICLKDSIIYGIDLETYDIVTPIWSRMQKRYIPLYTREQLEEYNRQHQSLPFEICIDKNSLGVVTIANEVIHTLDELSFHLAGPSEKEINRPLERSFVEGFKKRK